MLLPAVALAPFLGNEKVVEDFDEVHAALASGNQLRLDLIKTQAPLQFAVVAFLPLTEDDDLFQVQEFGDEEDGIAHFVQIDEAALVVDVREGERPAIVGDADVACGISGLRAFIADDISPCDGDERLDVDHDEATAVGGFLGQLSQR